MTPVRVAASAGEAQAMPGRGRNPLTGQDGDFGAILSDVVQGEAPARSTAHHAGSAGGAAAAAARKAASTDAMTPDVDALLAQLTTTATSPTVGRHTSSQAPGMKKHGDKPEPGRETITGSKPTATTELAAGTDVTAAASVALTGLAAPAFATNAADAKAPLHVDPPSTIGNVATQAPPGVDADGPAVTQATGRTKVTVVDVASHLTPARPSVVSQDGSSGAPAAAIDGPGKTKGETEPKPVAAVPAEPSRDDGPSHQNVDATASITAGGAEAAASPPVRQIADAVAGLAADTPAPEATTRAAAATPSPTRSLVLHLAPATLGAITVRLHLTDSGLSVRLAVENPATLGLISHSREALQAAIGASYPLDQLVIHGADTAPPPQAASHDPTRSDGGPLADQRSGSQRGNEDAPPRPGRPQRREAHAPGPGRADGIFL